MAFGIVRGNTDLLFCSIPWSDFQNGVRGFIGEEIARYDADELLNTSDDRLQQYFMKKYAVEVPTLETDEIVVSQSETKIDVSHDSGRYIRDRSRPFHVPGTEVVFEIPFTGDAQLFRVQPNTFTLNPPRAKMNRNNLIVTISGVNLTPEKIKTEIDRTIANISENLQNLSNGASSFNTEIRGLVASQVKQRKDKLLGDRNLVADLGFKLKKRPSEQMTYSSRQVVRKAPPKRPTASTAPYTPEPTLENSQFEEILTTMANMVSVMEKSPAAFADIGEEALRTHFLVQLNGTYQGSATGETFNYEGKTDILIQDGGKNIFIGECKFWKGEKAFLETIDQLLGYLSWRDSKAALLIFNRNKNFSGTLETIQQAVPKHANFIALEKTRSETSWLYRFSHRDDPNKEMHIAVLAFDVPSPAKQ